MSTEYYIRSSSQSQMPDIWNQLRALVSGQPFCLDVQDNVIKLKGTSSPNDWEFDVRLFGTNEILVEISSWNDSIRVEFGGVLKRLSEDFDFTITDEDFDLVTLI